MLHTPRRRSRSTVSRSKCGAKSSRFGTWSLADLGTPRAVDAPPSLREPPVGRSRQSDPQHAWGLLQHRHAAATKDHSLAGGRLFEHGPLGRLTEVLRRDDVGRRADRCDRVGAEERRDHPLHEATRRRLPVLDRLVDRDIETTGDAVRDRAVDERHPEPLRELRSDLSAAGPVRR